MKWNKHGLGGSHCVPFADLLMIKVEYEHVIWNESPTRRFGHKRESPGSQLN